MGLSIRLRVAALVSLLGVSCGDDGGGEGDGSSSSGSGSTSMSATASSGSTTTTTTTGEPTSTSTSSATSGPTTGMVTSTGGGAGCLQEQAIELGQATFIEDVVSLDANLAFDLPAGGAPTAPLPGGFSDEAYYGAVDPEDVSPWWEGWTATFANIAGNLPRTDAHPLAAEIANGAITPAASSSCLSIDANFADGGTVTVFGETFPVCVVNGPLLVAQTWPNNHVFVLNGVVVVGDGDAQLQTAAPTEVTLTIQAGTQIYGVEGSRSSLVVSRGATLQAQGTQDVPIVFSAVEATIGGITGDPSDLTGRGQWAGVVLSGFGVAAGSDIADERQSGDTNPAEARWFGGSDNADDSGTLQYVVIAEAGIEVDTGVRPAGLLLEGVGDGTTVDHIQVFGAVGDAIAWRGGAVEPTALVAQGAGEDLFDFDLGYVGTVQFGLGVMDPDEGARGVVLSNGGDIDAQPRTDPDLANITVLGNPGADAVDSVAVLHQHGAAGALYRSVLADRDSSDATRRFEDGCLDVDDALDDGLLYSDVIGNCSPQTAAVCEPGEL